jgi:hypothetical protein
MKSLTDVADLRAAFRSAQSSTADVLNVRI